MMIGRMRTDRERQSMAVHNREDLHAFAPARGRSQGARGQEGSGEGPGGLNIGGRCGKR
jgi:hypothetical protein